MAKKVPAATQVSAEASDEEGDDFAASAAEAEVNSRIVKASSTVEFPLKDAINDGAKVLKAKLCKPDCSAKLVLYVLLSDGGTLLVKRSDQESIARCMLQTSSGALAADICDSGQVAAAVMEGNIVYVWSLEPWSTPYVLYAVHASARVESSGSSEVGNPFICLSPTGRRMAVHATDTPLFVWELQDGDGGAQAARTIASCQGPSRGIDIECTSARFDFNEQALVAGFAGNYMVRLRVFEGCLYDLPSLSDGSNALSSSATLIAPKAYLRGHEQTVRDIAISRSGQIATCSADSKGFAWITPEYQCGMFLLHPSWCQVQRILVLSDGIHVVTAASDGFIRIWGSYPAFPRDDRGAVPILLKLAPATEVCRLGAHMVHLAYEQDTCSLVAVWACDSAAPSIPEPVADIQEVGHNFVPADLAAINASQANKKRKLQALAAAVGVRKDDTMGQEQVSYESHLMHIVVRYEAIPLLVRRYRSDMVVILHLLAGKFGFESSWIRKFTMCVFKYLR